MTFIEALSFYWTTFADFHPAVQQLLLLDLCICLITIIGILLPYRSFSSKLLIPLILCPPFLWLFVVHALGVRLFGQSKISQVLSALAAIFLVLLLLVGQVSFGAISHHFPDNFRLTRQCMLLVLPGLLIALKLLVSRSGGRRHVIAVSTLAPIPVIIAVYLSNAYFLCYGQGE